ncbi:MAG: tRNA pseudouridine(55) synthase TruB, partial [Pirellulales bacterium]
MSLENRSAMLHFGILNVNKPPGRTSREVVDDVERLTRPARAGHAGTLDPLATGVLVICVGRATRLIEYIQRMRKHYRATFLLGRRSDTDDIEGRVLELAEAPEPSHLALDRVLPKFLGTIQQRPPAHSAVKIAGQRAYTLARRGKIPELAPRPVTVHRLAVCRYEYPELELEIECGSGTYVRALGRDLAEALDTGAVMSALERTAIGRFRIENAVTIDELKAETLPRFLQPAIDAVADLPHIELTDPQLNEICNGRPISMPVGESCAAAKPPLGRVFDPEAQTRRE